MNKRFNLLSPTAGILSEVKQMNFAKAWRPLILDNTLQPHLKIVYLYLMARAINPERTTWITQNTIKRDLGYKSRGTISEYLQKLVDKRLIAKETGMAFGKKRISYKILNPEAVYGDDLYKSWDDLYKKRKKIEDDVCLPLENTNVRQHIEKCSLWPTPQVEESNEKNPSNITLQFKVGEPPAQEPGTLPKDEINGVNALMGVKIHKSEKALTEKEVIKRDKLAKKKKDTIFNKEKKNNLVNKSFVNINKAPEGSSQYDFEKEKCANVLFTFYKEKMEEYGFKLILTTRSPNEKTALETLFKRMESIKKSEELMGYVIKNWQDLRYKYPKLFESPTMSVFGSNWVTAFVTDMNNNSSGEENMSEELKERVRKMRNNE